MDLFEIIDRTSNLLPADGIVNYHGSVFAKRESDYYLETLLSNVEWKNDEAIIFGKSIITKRKVAWYGDREFEYTYSRTTKRALPWTDDLRALRTAVERESGDTFNSCLLNLYHNGEEGMAWHSDAETDLLRDGAIASLSFGAERKFAFKHKSTKQVVSMVLENGSLLVMKGVTQTNWLHRLPPAKAVKRPRVNLTFRTIVG